MIYSFDENNDDIVSPEGPWLLIVWQSLWDYADRG